MLRCSHDLSQGCAGIRFRECRSAVAAGINLMLWHDVTAGICQLQASQASWACGLHSSIASASSLTLARVPLQALSPTGRCQTFDSAADGYGRGEAIVASIMHGSRAERIQHGALALACGSAVNQDGRSSSLTAPNGPSQQV